MVDVLTIQSSFTMFFLNFIQCISAGIRPFKLIIFFEIFCVKYQLNLQLKLYLHLIFVAFNFGLPITVGLSLLWSNFKGHILFGTCDR